MTSTQLSLGLHIQYPLPRCITTNKTSEEQTILYCSCTWGGWLGCGAADRGWAHSYTLGSHSCQLIYAALSWEERVIHPRSIIALYISFLQLSQQITANLTSSTNSIYYPVIPQFRSLGYLSHFAVVFIFIVCLYTEREQEWVEGRGRGRESILRRLQAQHGAQHRTQSHNTEIMT